MAGDLYYYNVSLLLHCDGTDGSTTFTDNSPTPKTVTAYGNAHIETDQSKFGGASGAFDGTGDYLVVANNGSHNFGTGDFTIEAWVRLADAAAYRFLLGSLTNGYMMVAFNYTSNAINVGVGNVGWKANFSGHSISANTWAHVALTRSSGSHRCFVNGTQVGTTVSDTTNYSFPAAGMTVGTQTGGSQFSGYIDELRITKGVARYTANFTPPTEAFANYASDRAYLALTAYPPYLPGQIEAVMFDLQAFGLQSAPILAPTTDLALAAFPVELDGILLPSAIEFRHAPLTPWVMPMTSPVYPPATTLTLDVPVPGVNIHGLWSPEAMLFGWEYDSGTDTISIPLATLFELTASQANATTGDWRAVVLALVNSMWDSYVELDSPPRAMVLEYYPGYMMNVGPFTGHVKVDYQATTYLNFPDKTLADEP